ncbi:MAG: ABC transporter substrate-binding protein [Proteobacteria bacterium]|nr:ABC transporter substrate-binding protein [Pseudomonadota bacterium]
MSLPSVDGALRQAFAPGGTLRAAINLGNPVLAQPGPDGGRPRGVSVDLAVELARRLELPLETVTFDAAGKVFEAAPAGRWDIAFLAIDPVRAAEIDYTAPYVVIEGSYLVADTSPIRAIADADRAGVRIAVGRGAAYDLYLTRALQQATLVRAETSGGAIELFVRDGLEAAAGVRQPLERYAAAHPGYRVIDGRFTAIEQAMGMPKSAARAAALPFLRAYVEEMKASGFVAQALTASGQDGAAVAPPA